MSFYIRNYTSEEKYDIAKFMDYVENVFDTVDSPFLTHLNELSTVDYYNVDDGYKDIDMIAYDYYGDQFYAYLIQFYNGDFREHFPEGTTLRMFSVDELNDLYASLVTQSNLQPRIDG